MRSECGTQPPYEMDDFMGVPLRVSSVAVIGGDGGGGSGGGGGNGVWLAGGLVGWWWVG